MRPATLTNASMGLAGLLRGENRFNQALRTLLRF